MKRMRKRISATLLAFLVFICAVPMNVFAAEEGQLEAGVEWTADPTGENGEQGELNAVVPDTPEESEEKAEEPALPAKENTPEENAVQMKAAEPEEEAEGAAPPAKENTPEENVAQEKVAEPEEGGEENAGQKPSEVLSPPEEDGENLPDGNPGDEETGCKAKLTGLTIHEYKNKNTTSSAYSFIQLDQEFDSGRNAYTASVYYRFGHDLYLWVTAENAEFITASFIPYGSDQAQEIEVNQNAPATSGTKLSGILQCGKTVLTITLEDADGKTEEYTVDLVFKPVFTSIVVSGGSGEKFSLEPKFSPRDTFDYTMTLPAEEKTLKIQPNQDKWDEVSAVTVGGEEISGAAEIQVPDEDVFTIPVTIKDRKEGGGSTTYNLNVRKSYDVTFQGAPPYAVFTVADEDGNIIEAESGVYTLPAGNYTYSMEAKGFYPLSGTLVSGKGMETSIQVAPEKIEGEDIDVYYVEYYISQIGNVYLNSESKERIDAARAAYNLLPEESKLKVANYDVLTEAEHYYNHLLEKVENPPKDSLLEWNQFLGNEDLKGISDAKTPQSGEDLKEQWKIHADIGMNMMRHVSAPAYYKNFVYVTMNNKIYKIEPESGEIVAENDAPNSMLLLPQVTCADNKVFAMIMGEDQKSRVRVYDAETLEMLYQTIGLEGFQIETPIMYHGGYFYFATYDSAGKYYAFLAPDKKLDYELQPEWSVSPSLGDSGKYKVGFLWAGAEFVGDYAYFGDTNATLWAVNSRTGEIVDSMKMNEGDFYQFQSTPNYYEKNQRLYMTLAAGGGMGGGTKSGAIVSMKLNSDGTFDRDSQLWFKSDIKGEGIKSSPVIYNDRLYVCGGGGHSGSAEPFRVLDANTLEEIYRIPEICSKGTPVLSTAYATKENGYKVYLYVVPYRPEDVTVMYIIQDSVGQTEPVYEKVRDIGVKQYCSQSMTIGENGLLYYYNDENYLYCYGMDSLENRLITGADVNRQIERQPEVDEYKYYNDAEIRRIKTRYDALDETQKGLVTLYQKLLDILAVSTMNPAERMNGGIAAIPALEKITLDDRDMITNLYQGYQKMEKADQDLVTDYEKLEAAYARIPVLEKQALVAGVIRDIDKLPAKKALASSDKAAVESLLERVRALGDDAAVTNLAKLTEAKARIDEIAAQMKKVDDLIEQIVAGETITLEKRSLIDAVDKAAEGLVKTDYQSLRNYEYYVSPAKAELVNALMEKYGISANTAVTKENRETLRAALKDIEKLYEGILETDRKYVKNYDAVSELQKKIDNWKEPGKQPSKDPGNSGSSGNSGSNPSGAANPSAPADENGNGTGTAEGARTPTGTTRRAGGVTRTANRTDRGSEDSADRDDAENTTRIPEEQVALGANPGLPDKAEDAPVAGIGGDKTEGKAAEDKGAVLENGADGAAIASKAPFNAMAVLPWILCGICAAGIVICLVGFKKKKDGNA